MSNQYAKELFTLLANRYDIDQAGMTMSQWIEKNTSLKGRPFSYGRYPYQRAVIDDDHKNQVGIKPSQVGWSEINHRWSFAFLKRNRNTKMIYAYPDDDMRKKNVQTRMMPILDNNKVFNSVTGSKPIRSIELLQIDQSFAYVTGSKVGDATSTDADALVLDEYDLHNMQIAALFQSRLQNSDWKIKKYFSTPTFTEFGVDQLYRDSDQMEYMIKCDACNHWMFPLFVPRFIHIPNLPTGVDDLTEIDQSMIDSRHLDLENAYVCCERCRAPLDLGREDNRSWVAKYPSRRAIRGRRINPFSVSTRPVGDIITEMQDYKRRDFMRGFKNSVLGEPEDSSSARISEADIRMCFGPKEVPKITTDLPTWIGIDMGHNCHIVVGQGYSIEAVNVVRMLHVPIAKLLDTIAELDSTYMIVGGCVDRHPESQAAADVRDATQRRIMPCEYRGTKEINLVAGPEGPEDIIHIQADRTTLLDEVASIIRKHKIQFCGYESSELEIITHLRNMVRVEAPETPATWNKLDSQDHFFHALGFMLTAMKMKRLLSLKTESVQTYIGIAGAADNSYNGDIFGNPQKPRKQTEWQTQFLNSGRRL
jgi:hypothetical protein